MKTIDEFRKALVDEAFRISADGKLTAGRLLYFTVQESSDETLQRLRDIIMLIGEKSGGDEEVFVDMVRALKAGL